MLSLLVVGFIVYVVASTWSRSKQRAAEPEKVEPTPAAETPSPALLKWRETLAEAQRRTDSANALIHAPRPTGQALLDRLAECRQAVDDLDAWLADKPGIRFDNAAELLINLTASELKVGHGKVYAQPDHTLVAIVDTETTGLAEEDEPISFGGILIEVRTKNGHLVTHHLSYEGYREPRVPIHPKAQQVHGKSIEDLRGQRFDWQAIARILLQADVVIAHNAAFDRRMLARLAPQISGMNWACSIRSVRWRTGGRQSLDALCEHFGIKRPQPHSALADCWALERLLLTTIDSDTRSSAFLRQAITRPWVGD